MEIDRLTPTSRTGDDVDDLRSIFRSTVAFAAELDAPGITLLPGVVAEGQPVSEAISLAAEGLVPLVDMGAERGLEVSIEPHVGSCVETPEATAELLDQCPGLGITLDPSHFIYGGCTTERMTSLAARTRHLQIRPASPGVMQSKVRDNQIDLALLVAALRGVEYDGWIASEYVWMEKWECDRVDNTGESALLRDVLASLLEDGEA
jgi:sugar phosphate isomerase/epimerase